MLLPSIMDRLLPSLADVLGPHADVAWHAHSIAACRLRLDDLEAGAAPRSPYPDARTERRMVERRLLESEHELERTRAVAAAADEALTARARRREVRRLERHLDRAAPIDPDTPAFLFDAARERLRGLTRTG